jgi:protein SCO1
VPVAPPSPQGPTGGPQRWRRRLTASLVTGTLLLAACSSSPSLSGVERDDALIVGQVSLPDVTAPGLRAGGRVADGRLVFAADEGRLLLVYFGFLNCATICPTTLFDLRAALAALPPETAARVDVAFVTVDPDRDGPQELADYLRHFFPRHHALRGTEEELDTALAAFLASVRIVLDDDGEPEIEHTSRLYAVDARGMVRVEWPFGTSVEALRADLMTLLAETDA